jgi:hypothetical protein
MPRSTAKAKEATIDVLIDAGIVPGRRAAYTKTVTASALGVSRETIYVWISKGWLRTNIDGHVLYESLRDKVCAKEIA